MNRQTLFILLGVILVVIITVLLVNRFTGGLRDLAPVTVQAEQVTEQDVDFQVLTSDGTKLFYYGVGENDRTGIVRVDLATGNRELFRPLPPVSGIEWSPNRSQAILSIFFDEEQIKRTDPRFLTNQAFSGAVTIWLYDIERDRLEQLPSGTSSAAWSPDGSRILYHYFDLSGVNPVSELSLRMPFSPSHEKLADIPAAASYTLAFLDTSTVMAVPNLSDPSGKSTVYFIDLASKTRTSIQEDNVSTALAAPDGQRILFASAGDEPDWRFFERTTNSQRDLKIAAAGQYGGWIDSDTFVIIEPGAGRDRMWIVETESFTRQEVLIDGPGTIESAPQAVGDALYFVSGRKLFKIKLP